MMESLANVNLDISEIKHVVAKTGACLVWGGAVNLSPADDMLIRIERALDIDGEGQLIASVLSKKIAAGSTHVVIDIPVGETAKVRSEKSAQRLSKLFTSVGKACGIVVRCLISEGNNPVGVGIGPAEEAKDVLSVFSCEDSAPQDLKERALTIAANIFDLNDGRGYEAGLLLATKVLNSGEALRQFNRIVLAQGKPKKLGSARYRHTETSMQSGVLVRIDNRKLARLAKLAGAPFSLNAGLRLYVSLGSTVSKGCQMFTILSDSYGELNYALDYYYNNMDIFYIEV